MRDVERPAGKFVARMETGGEWRVNLGSREGSSSRDGSVF